MDYFPGFIPGPFLGVFALFLISGLFLNTLFFFLIQAKIVLCLHRISYFGVRNINYLSWEPRVW